jgi:energy-coupling factor transporter ATP-binding protein EcfA2
VPSPPARATGPVSPVVLRVRIDPPAPDAQGPVIRIDEPLEFELRAGAPVALVGPNGTGKTVALEAIAGVRPHPQVHVSGGPDRPTPVLAAQYPDLQVFGNTVAEEIGWAAAERGRAAGVSQARALELFAELSLGPQILDRSTWALSAGQRRLVQVVAALVTPASLVVVDEPTCGLDPARATGLGQLMGRAAQLIPLLVATQDEPFSGRIRASLRGLGRVVGNAASTYGKTD